MENNQSVLEKISTPEQAQSLPLDHVDQVHGEAIKKVELIGGTDELEGIRNTSLKKLTNLRNAVITALFLNSVNGVALAKEVPISHEIPSLTPEKIVTEQESAQKLPDISSGQAFSISNTILEAAENKLKEEVGSKKESFNNAFDEKKNPGERVDAGIDVIKTVPGIAKKFPLISIIESLRDLQKDIEEEKPIEDILGNLARAAISAKTLGLSDIVYGQIQVHAEKERLEKKHELERITKDLGESSKDPDKYGINQNNQDENMQPE